MILMSMLLTCQILPVPHVNLRLVAQHFSEIKQCLDSLTIQQQLLLLFAINYLI